MMKSLYCSFRSEIIKLRHTPIIWLHIVMPILGGVIFVLYFKLYTESQSIDQRLDLILAVISVIFPIIISIVVSMGITLEEENHFQLLFTGTKHKGLLVIAKLLLFWILGLLALGILFFSIVIAAIISDEYSPLFLRTVLNCYMYTSLSCLAIYIFHFWLSMKSGLGASILTGVVESLMVILFSNLPLKLAINWGYIPWAWEVNLCRKEILQFKNQFFNFQQNIILKIVIITIVMLTIYYIWFERWEGRGIYEE